MIRKLYAVVALAVMTLLVTPAVAIAAAPPYPAPPVVAGDTASTVVVAVAPAAQQANIPSAPLPSTGAGLDIGLWLGIGAVILIAGILLTIVGTRLVTSKGVQH